MTAIHVSMRALAHCHEVSVAGERLLVLLPSGHFERTAVVGALARRVHESKRGAA